MMPSMFAGVSGLRNHQIRLNVIGNNLANINTVGYKYGRVIFSDLMSQTLKTASGAESGRGGINPAQVGLGMNVSSIDAIHSQGNIESTGKLTDLAIQGDGFFIFSKDNGQLYSRAGALDLDSEGTLVNTGNGLCIQGWQAADGIVDTSAALTNISLPIGESVIAKATSGVVYTGNLDSAGTVTQGTITSSPGLLAAGSGADLLTGLMSSAGSSLGVQDGDTINISGSIGGHTITATLAVTAATTLANVATALQTAMRTASSNSETASVQTNGSIRATSNGEAISNLQLTITDNSVFNNAFNFPSTIATPGTGDSDATRALATSTDTLVDLYNESGVSLGLTAGDDITLLNGSVRGSLITSASILADIATTTTLENYRAALSTVLFGAFPNTGESVSINSNGSLNITGAEGADNEVTGLVFGAGASAGDNTRTVFATAQNYTDTQTACDASSYSISTGIYDSLGISHTIDTVFTKTANNTWGWEATSNGTNVGSGTMLFNSDGTIANTNGTISLTITNGADNPITITPDFAGISQLASDSSISLSSQNGYPMGTLTKFEISNIGLITGVFSNGLNQKLGQIALARFTNPNGLMREGDNMYSESTNSGIAQIGEANVSGRGSVSSGTLEMSNVDIAREFTNMIITERGFQANSKVITTSDEMLQDLVNLKR